MTAVLFAVDQILAYFLPDYRERLNRRFVQKTRERIYWAAVLFVILASGFLAWRDEYIARGEAEKKLAEKEAEPTQQKLAALESQISRFIEQQAPRVLTDQQRNTLLVRLRDARKSVELAIVRIHVTISDAEAYAYAQQISEVFREADWLGGGGLMVAEGSLPSGVALLVREEARVPPLTHLVADSFSKIGMSDMPILPIKNRDERENFVHIIVGSKPK